MFSNVLCCGHWPHLSACAFDDLCDVVGLPVSSSSSCGRCPRRRLRRRRLPHTRTRSELHHCSHQHRSRRSWEGLKILSGPEVHLRWDQPLELRHVPKRNQRRRS